MKKELSPYTIAKNCTDLSDINVGIKEMKNYFSYCDKKNIHPTSTDYSRYAKLLIKKDKLTLKKH